jgi:hypothetical protein
MIQQFPHFVDARIFLVSGRYAEAAKDGGPPGGAASLALRRSLDPDQLESPAADWSVKRRLEYIDWTKSVVAGLRGISRWLERSLNRKRRSQATALASWISRYSHGKRSSIWLLG